MRWRPVAVGALSLIALQVFVSGKGPQAGGRLLGWAAAGLNKALSPNVAAIPYVKAPGAAAAKPPPAKDGAVPAAGPNGLPRNPTTTVTT